MKSKTALLETQKADAEKKVEILKSTVKENEPKVSYYDIILNNPKAVPVTLIAKDYGYTAVMFNKLLQSLFFLGAEKRIFALLTGMMTGVIVMLIVRKIRKETNKEPFALVPFLCFGAMLAFMV